MLDAVAVFCWLVAGFGLVLVVASTISLVTKRLLGLSDETVNDPWFRRNDTAGLSRGIYWLKPGLVIMFAAGAVAVVLEAVA